MSHSRVKSMWRRVCALLWSNQLPSKFPTWLDNTSSHIFRLYVSYVVALPRIRLCKGCHTSSHQYICHVQMFSSFYLVSKSACLVCKVSQPNISENMSSTIHNWRKTLTYRPIYWKHPCSMQHDIVCNLKFVARLQLKICTSLCLFTRGSTTTCDVGKSAAESIS